MKTILFLLAIAGLAYAQEDPERVVLIPWAKAPKEAPLFFSATAEVNARVALETVTSEQKIAFRVHQGKAETLTLGLNGAGEVLDVTGAALRDWSVRVAENGARFLDIRPAMVDSKFPAELQIVVKTRAKVEKGSTELMLPSPGNATGFSLSASLTENPGVDLKVTRADGLVPVGEAHQHKFVGSAAALLAMNVSPGGTGARGLEIRNMALDGKVAENGESVSFRLTGTLRSAGTGSAVELLSGGAALTNNIAGDGWHVVLRKNGGAWSYELMAERGGEFPVAISFDVPIHRKDDWRKLSFRLPAGVVAPLMLDGVAGGVAFDRSLTVVPEFGENHWRGFLPASGEVSMAWHPADPLAEGALFFSSSETTDVRVGSGLLRQKTAIDLRVLQGKLGLVRMRLDGPGEILGVEGSNVLSWKVLPGANGGARTLEVNLSKPFENRADRVGTAVNGGELVIRKATYGVPGGPPERSVDVTRKVTELLRDGKKVVPVDYRVLEVDPASGQVKRLTVSFVFNGVPGTAEADEGSMLDLKLKTAAVNVLEPLGEATLVVRSQTVLGNLPVRGEALRITPEGSVRHSGFVRIANDGAVRIEVVNPSGLIQLAPAQFPSGVDESLRQVFVYQFPSSEYGYAVNASQVLPETGLTEVTVYELSETDRRIAADLELDIREAPLREWEMEIPADYAVASVTGTEVADYVVGGEARDGRRMLKILFKRAVADRQLVSVRLEKNEAAKAGSWTLPPLGFPGVKSHRGYLGAVAAPGYRLTAGKTAGVAEVPVTFFPKKAAGLQQAFRLREAVWSVALDVEALGQSIQADVFHLYSLKTGAVYGSVLMNFFVVGSPATEWRISVPKEIGNIDVTGQNVGRDWRRDGNMVTVPLSRPVLGPGTVLLTFERPMNSRGGKLSLGDVTPLGVQAERGFVQVVSPLQVNRKAESAGALMAIDPTELPAEFRLLSSAPSLGVWQYTSRDFKLGMEIEWFDPGETIEQVVDFQKLSSHVSRDGQWVTESRMFVKSRGRSALRMVLPEGAVLWEAKIDGEAVNARADGGKILVPLPSRLDPNRAAEVSLRYGARSEKPMHPRLAAPILDAPVVIGEWTVTGDEGRQLVPRGGTADLVEPVLAESGWAWIGRHRGHAALALLAGVTALAFGCGKPVGVRKWLSLASGSMFVILVILLGIFAAMNSREGAEALEYAAPVVASGGEVSVEIGNVPVWLARTGMGVWLGFALGTAVAVWGLLRGDRWRMGCGFILVVAAFLSIRGGTPLFFGALALTGLAWLLPRIGQAIRGLRKPSSAGAVTAAIVIGCMWPWDADAAEVPDMKPMESMIHDWQIRDGRLHGTVDVTLRAEAGDRFLLLREPAVLRDFEAVGLKAVKMPLGNGSAYGLIAETGGRLTGRAVFEMPLAEPAMGWEMPGGPAAMRRVTLRWDQSGWEFSSPDAASIQPIAGLATNQSGAVLMLGPGDPVKIHARPKQRDVETEETKFFAEISNLFLPGPGVVNGRHRVTIRPTQGRVTALAMTVPGGFTVSDVTDGPVGNWRFDPVKRELRVNVEPAQDRAFGFTIETQQGMGALPVDLALAPLRVQEAVGEVGMLGIAVAEDVQPEAMETDGLSRVNPEDFDGSLLPGAKDGEQSALLQHAFRYGTAAAEARLKIAAVAPELRAESWQLVSLGEDRLLVATDLAVTITRSGVFRLELEVPEGLEIETVTGGGLSHWTEGKDGGKRMVTLHLSGKTMGRRDFSLALTGRPTGGQEKWSVPRVRVRGASRETGVLTVVPERGLQVRAVERRNVSQLDPRELADGPRESARAAMRPGALVYRLLQSDWTLALSISRLDSWVTARVFHDATIREGQLLTRVNIGYRIENAAVKSLRVRIPGLDASSAATVRAHGADVSDLAPVEGEAGLWEIRFQRGLAGETSVVLEYQRPSARSGGESIEPVVLEDIRQLVYFAAVRAGGRLELEPGPLPRGWQRTDWAVVQSTMGRDVGGAAPAMTFRVADPEGALPVIPKRHELAGLRKLRVSEGSLTTLMSPGGMALTAVDLQMQAIGKNTLRLTLPEGAGLFNAFVNGEGVPLVREGGGWLFYVSAPPETGRPANVRFVYSSAIRSGKRLEGPVLDVPMETLTWRVLVPEGWRLADHGGDFELKQQESMGSFRLEDYRSFVASKQRSDAQSAVELLDQANAWLEAGDQEKASLAFGNAVRNTQLDAASGEDARVQLRQLKTQQAMLGLNTRRQKLVLDNRLAAPEQTENAQFNRAAEVNPVLRGAYNYDPKQFERFLEGNTADENAALKEIANRIVAQQLAAEPAPTALEVTLPERGTMLSFGRSVQVDGGRPMTLDIELKRAGGGFAWIAIALCLLAGGMAARGSRR